MRIKLSKLIAVGFALAMNLPSGILAGGPNWFTSTGMVEDGERPLPGAIEEGNTLTFDTAVNPRLIDLSVSLHNSPAGDDDGSTQDTDPGSVEQDKIEKIIQFMADAVYEATEGVHKIRQVRIFRDKKRHDIADIRWDESGHPSANFNGITDSGLHIYMYDIFTGGKKLPNGTVVDHSLLTDRIGAGYTLAHELGHYAYGLKDEYPMAAFPTDVRVVPSIMSSQWRARNEASQTLVDARWLQFSIKNQNATHPGLYQNTLQTAQHREYGESCFETLARDNTIIETISAALTGNPLRVIYPELKNAAPNGTDSPSSPDLPGSARSDLDIIWMANTTIFEIVIDSSGSMSGDKISNARTAAKLLVDVSEIGSYIGVIKFASSVTQVFPLTEIVDQATKNSIKTAIDTIGASGSTAIGDAAAEALDALVSLGVEGNKVVYLLSDGQSNIGRDPLAPIPDYQNEKVPIFAFAYGSGADIVTLGEMAALTKGQLYISPVTLADITQAFQDANAAASGASNVASGSNTAPAGSSQTVPFTVDSTLDTMSVTVTFTGSPSILSVELIDPSMPGSPKNATETTVSGGETLLLFTVTNPSAGEWLVRTMATGATEVPFVWVVSGTQQGLSYTLTGGTSDGIREIEYPNPFVLRSSLVKDLPIMNAVVEATVIAPDGSSTVIPMVDDGTPPDKMAGDGEYTAAINYDQSGVYQLSVRARGLAGVAMQDSHGLEPAPGLDGNQVPFDNPSPITEDFERFVRFQVETKNVVPDDHGNTHDTATPLSAKNDETLSGNIETAGDVDVFSIMPEGLTELAIRVSNLAFNMLPVLKIQNELNLTVAEGNLDTSSSGAGILSLKVPVVGNGTYFAEVSHQNQNGTGYYQISAGGVMEQFDAPAATPRPTDRPTDRPTASKSSKSTKAGKGGKSLKI